MSQVDAYTIPGSPLTMAQLAARLEALFGASVSINRGNGAPTNPVVGMLWWDTSAGSGLEVLKVYRSVGWRSILSLNVNSGLLTWGDTIQIAQGGTGATTAAVARTNLGLGTAAVQPDTRYNHRSNNLSDVADVTTARQNIGAHNATNLTTGTLADARLSTAVTTVALGGAFSSSVNFYKVGRLVTMYTTSGVQHSSGSSTPTSAAEVVPVALRPLSNYKVAVVLPTSSTGLNLFVNSNGSVQIQHVRADGTIRDDLISTSNNLWGTWVTA
jgi:hypothetical protein